MIVAVNINPKKYGSLLSKVQPAIIETEEENKRMLAEVDKLMDKHPLSPEESRLFDLMVRLIQDFEDRNYQLNATSPLAILRDIMETRGVEPHDLWPVFGSKGTTSDVLNGKRGISKAHAKALGFYFSVSPELFI